jgi:hypothetical protein
MERVEDEHNRLVLIELMEACEIIFPVRTDGRGKAWIVPEHLRSADERERATWGDALLNAEATLSFLPDFALLAWIGLRFDHRVAGVPVRRDQFAYADRVGEERTGVEVLIQTDPGAGRASVWMKGGDAGKRKSALDRLAEHFKERHGLALKFNVHTKDEDGSARGGEEPQGFGAAIAHLRDHEKQYGLTNGITKDFERQLREIFKESVNLKEQQLAVYRALNVGAVLLKGKAVFTLECGRLARGVKHVRAVREGLSTTLRVDNGFWEAFGVRLPTNDADAKTIRVTYQRAFRDVFKLSKKKVRRSGSARE